MLPLSAEVVEVVSGLLTIVLPEYTGSDRSCLCSVMDVPLQGLIGLLPLYQGMTGGGVCNEGCAGMVALSSSVRSSAGSLSFLRRANSVPWSRMSLLRASHLCTCESSGPTGRSSSMRWSKSCSSKELAASSMRSNGNVQEDGPLADAVLA